MGVGLAAVPGVEHPCPGPSGIIVMLAEELKKS